MKHRITINKLNYWRNGNGITNKCLNLKYYINNTLSTEINVQHNDEITIFSKTETYVKNSVFYFNDNKYNNNFIYKIFYESGFGINRRRLDLGRRKFKYKNCRSCVIPEKAFELLQSNDDLIKNIGLELISLKICEHLKLNKLYDLIEYI